MGGGGGEREKKEAVVINCEKELPQSSSKQM
jgi:hypothetical protein